MKKCLGNYTNKFRKDKFVGGEIIGVGRRGGVEGNFVVSGVFGDVIILLIQEGMKTITRGPLGT